jgi:hypothetical protein
VNDWQREDGVLRRSRSLNSATRPEHEGMNISASEASCIFTDRIEAGGLNERSEGKPPAPRPLSATVRGAAVDTIKKSAKILGKR